MQCTHVYLFAVIACAIACSRASVSTEPASPPKSVSAPSPFIVADSTPFGPAAGACPASPAQQKTPWHIASLKEGLAASIMDELEAELEADLDGDGINERVQIRVPTWGSDDARLSARGMGATVLTVNTDDRWAFTGSYLGLRIVDLDPRDPARQILIDTASDGQIWGYKQGRAFSIVGTSRRLPKTNDGRITTAIIANEVIVLIELGGETIRARYPAHSCSPSLGVTGLDLDSKNAQSWWLVSVGGMAGPEPQKQFSTYLVISREAGLRVTGPFIAANSVKVSKPGQIAVTHWNCGMRHEEIWGLSAQGLTKTSEALSGKHNPDLCGRVQLIDEDLDGDGAIDTIVVKKDLVAVNDRVIQRESDFESTIGQIVNIDPRDQRKEINVAHAGPYDDEINFIYTYDGTDLYESPGFYRLLIEGNGRVQTSFGRCGNPITKQIWVLSDIRFLKVREVIEKRGAPPEECQGL